MAGGTQTLSTPVNAFSALGYASVTVPGPYTISVSTTAESSAAFSVQLVGILEDL